MNWSHTQWWCGVCVCVCMLNKRIISLCNRWFSVYTIHFFWHMMRYTFRFVLFIVFFHLQIVIVNYFTLLQCYAKMCIRSKVLRRTKPYRRQRLGTLWWLKQRLAVCSCGYESSAIANYVIRNRFYLKSYFGMCDHVRKRIVQINHQFPKDPFYNHTHKKRTTNWIIWQLIDFDDDPKHLWIVFWNSFSCMLWIWVELFSRFSMMDQWLLRNSQQQWK